MGFWASVSGGGSRGLSIHMEFSTSYRNFPASHSPEEHWPDGLSKVKRTSCLLRMEKELDSDFQ